MWKGRGQTIDWKERDRLLLENTKEVQELCTQLGLPHPWGPYHAAPHTCFSCQNRTVVYGWHGHEVRGDAPPPPPRPRTVCRRTTRESGDKTYWANTCAHCGKTQGDDYLYLQGDRPLERRGRQPHVQLPGDGPAEAETGPQASSRADGSFAGHVMK